MLMTERDYGVTRACGLAQISRSLYRYRRPRNLLVQRSATATQTAHVLTVALLPSIALWARFAVTCAIECSILPWLSMIAEPGIAILAIIIMGIVIYKKAARYDG
jgi:hypothetical protein